MTDIDNIPRSQLLSARRRIFRSAQARRRMGDDREADRLFDQLREIDARLKREQSDRVERIEAGGSLWSRYKSWVIVGAVVAVIVISVQAGDEDRARRAETRGPPSSEPTPERDRDAPTEVRLRIAAEYALADVARDPESVEVERCALVDTYTGSLPVSFTCVYRARNGFGGMNREAGSFEYHGVGDARYTGSL